MKKEYALYKGDKFIGIGTSKELAKLMDIKINTFWFYMSKYWLDKSNYESWVIVELEDEEDEK